MTPSTDSIDAHGSAELKVIEGAKVRVEFSFYMPASATEREITDWLEFELNVSCQMSGENPLVNHDLDAEWLNWKTR